MPTLSDNLTKAQEELVTIQRLAADARKVAYYTLAHAYDSSANRLQGIIKVHQLSLQPSVSTCQKHPNKYIPCVECFKEANR